MTKFEETKQELTKAEAELRSASQELQQAQITYESADARYQKAYHYVRYLEYTIEGMLDEANKFGRTTEA